MHAYVVYIMFAMHNTQTFLWSLRVLPVTRIGDENSTRPSVRKLSGEKDWLEFCTKQKKNKLLSI